jgi:hypothetical protein
MNCPPLDQQVQLLRLFHQLDAEDALLAEQEDAVLGRMPGHRLEAHGVGHLLHCLRG